MKTSGNPKGETLVMLHGWGMNSGAWGTIRPALEARYHVSWVDLPGYGENGLINANDMDAIVDLILPEIPDGAHLLGWSLGGLIAQAIAEKSHKIGLGNIKSISLVASTPSFSQAEGWVHAMPHQTLDDFSKKLQEDIEGTLKRFIALQFMGIKGSKEIQTVLINTVLPETIYKTAKKGGGVLSNIHNNLQIEALNLGLSILKHADFRKTSHNIPQHWILADRDRLIPPALINDLKVLRPDDQITLLEQTGHAPFMTHPQEFMASLTPFIENNS